MDIKTLAEQYNDYIIDRRRYYHTCPELSGEEKNTRAHLKEDLEALGITDIHELETCYGLTATIHGGKPGKTVALRSDIDALPVKEETGLPFASHNEGKMHACGHDNHMAMLLGTAKILNEVKDELSGDVRLVFQPAEETAVGALRMMKEHALDGVDAIYGVHVWGTYDAPGIAFPAGNLMACCHGFTIEVEGKSAHASAPHEAWTRDGGKLHSPVHPAAGLPDERSPQPAGHHRGQGHRRQPLERAGRPRHTGGHRAYLPHRHAGGGRAA